MEEGPSAKRMKIEDTSSEGKSSDFYYTGICR